MIVDKLYTTNSILEKSMQGVVARNEVIQNNIANADTPNFQRSDLVFEEYLADAVNSFKETGELNLDSVKPTILNQNFSYRLDGNDVDIESEMVDLYQNSAKYDMLVSSVTNNYRRINAALGK
ncbi:MAG: flagellar basal body rod protein FlgB [Lachnospirales bacterium]